MSMTSRRRRPGAESLRDSSRVSEKLAHGVAAVFAAAALSGCHDDMVNQPRYEPLEASDFFVDGRSARPLVPGVVPYGAASATDARHTGRVAGELVAELPVELNEALLRRGQERFDIYCSVCHSRTGDGDGMIVQRGYRRPPTLHSQRLRGVPVGHFFDVATNGFGAMPSYAAQISVDDRWAIAAYIRALQWSQFARADELPADIRTQLEGLESDASRSVPEPVTPRYSEGSGQKGSADLGTATPPIASNQP